MPFTSGDQLLWYRGRFACFLILVVSLLMSACTHHADSPTDYKESHGAGHGMMASSSETSNDATFHRSFHHGTFSPSFEEELGLNDQKKEALHRMETDYRKMVIAHNADIRALEVDLARILDDETPDRSALEEKSQAIGKIKSDLMMSRMDSLLKVKELLTEGQYEQFRAILRDRMGDMEGSPHH